MAPLCLLGLNNQVLIIRLVTRFMFPRRHHQRNPLKYPHQLLSIDVNLEVMGLLRPWSLNHLLDLGPEVSPQLSNTTYPIFARLLILNLVVLPPHHMPLSPYDVRCPFLPLFLAKLCPLGPPPSFVPTFRPTSVPNIPPLKMVPPDHPLSTMVPHRFIRDILHRPRRLKRRYPLQTSHHHHHYTLWVTRDLLVEIVIGKDRLVNLID